MKRLACGAVAALALSFGAGHANADENLFGYLKGAEPLPRGAREFYLNNTLRQDKDQGHYSAFDLGVEYEYGLTDRLAVAGEIKGMGLDTSGLVIDGYLPGDRKFGLKWSGLEAALKYNFLSAARGGMGVSLFSSLVYLTVDPHSGHDKNTLSLEEKLLLQKYFLDGQVVWVGNVHFEGTRAVRKPIANLPSGFDWPTEAEMELEVGAGTGLTYRFAPNWFIGAEAFYVEERETEVDLERWSLQAGPTLHYGSEKWWATLTWFPQLRGGGETYPGQGNDHLHLVEKTRHETRLKFGLNF